MVGSEQYWRKKPVKGGARSSLSRRRPLMVGSERFKRMCAERAVWVIPSRRPLMVGSERHLCWFKTFRQQCRRPLMVGSEPEYALRVPVPPPLLIAVPSWSGRNIEVVQARNFKSPSPHGRVGTQNSQGGVGVEE